MPILRVETNLPGSALPENFAEDLTKLASKLIGKPEKLFCIILHPDKSMLFGGSNEPCAFVSVSSIGKIGPELNQKYAAELTPFLSEQLKIATDRFYIQFLCREPDDVAWQSKTLATMNREAALREAATASQ